MDNDKVKPTMYVLGVMMLLGYIILHCVALASLTNGDKEDPVLPGKSGTDNVIAVCGSYLRDMVDCTLLASARHLSSAGCRGAARGELAGFIFTIDCILRASARHPTLPAPVAWPAHPPPPLGAHLQLSFLPAPFYPPPHSLPSPAHPSTQPLPLLGNPSSHRTHSRPWSLPRRRPSSARPWYPPTPSDTIDQAPSP
jgi:hypothetical protein